LRGCIGTLEPYENNLYIEIIRNAVAAAFRDSRFPPLKKHELSDINISVDVLSTAIEYHGEINWDTKRHGIIVKSTSGKRAILLPDIPGINTAVDQLEIVKKKAGIYSQGQKNLRIFLFEAIRYH